MAERFDPVEAAEALNLRAHLDLLYGQEVEATTVWNGQHGHQIFGRLTDFDGGTAIVTDDDFNKWTCDPETVKAVD